MVMVFYSYGGIECKTDCKAITATDDCNNRNYNCLLVEMMSVLLFWTFPGT